MSNLFPNTPAITREAEDPELEQLAFEAVAALAASQVAGVTYLARLREAGDFLTKAKKRIKHGNWIPWLRRHNISRNKAFRAIKAYSKCSTVEHLDDAIGELAENCEEQEKSDPSTPSTQSDKQFCSRNCRVGIGPSNCKACAKLNGSSPSRPRNMSSGGGGSHTRSGGSVGSGRGRFNRSAPPPPPVREPITLEQVFEQGQVCLSQAKRAKSMSKKIRAIERSDIYRTGTGVREERMAEALLNTSIALLRVAFPLACLTCKGNVNPNKNSDPCKGPCKGNGYFFGINEEKRASR